MDIKFMLPFKLRTDIMFIVNLCGHQGYINNLRETIMQKLTIAAVTIAFGALVASAPAHADRNWGPTQQNGQCWNASVGHNGPNAGTFGYWGACPQTASVAVAPARRASHRRHASR
jgi:hypothetical protein